MLSIKEDVVTELIINKSKFITLMIKINNERDIEKNLLQIKADYKDATHYCYAYIVGTVKRFNDDGEPGGTAGVPILKVLENNQLNNVLCVVVRYFGGIKLGAGGLVRAYTKAVTNCLINCEIIALTDGILIEIIFDYNNTKEIDYLLKDLEIINKSFDINIKYTFKIDNEYYKLIIKKIKKLTINIKEIKKILIEK